MEILQFLIIIILTVLLFLTMFKLNDVSARLARTNRRYNQLLRGRGELNMEELLGELSYSVQTAEEKVENMERITRGLQHHLDESTSNFVKELDQSIGKVDTNLSSRINRIESEYSSKINSLDSDLNGKIEMMMQNQSKFESSLTDTTERRINTISDNQAFAIQKVNLYKYDAFDNQTGRLSFTLVLLDKFDNGLMITSINGRDSSYTYSKYIKNGKSDQEMSGDEEIALSETLKK